MLQSLVDTQPSERNVVNEFMAWMQMTPAQQMRDRILKELGLTEEQLQDLPLEEQVKIEQLIAQKFAKKWSCNITSLPLAMKSKN